MSKYIRYHPRHINGRSRNEPIPMDPGELEAMANAMQSRRRTDGLTRKQRREAYVRSRRELQDIKQLDGSAK